MFNLQQLPSIVTSSKYGNEIRHVHSLTGPVSKLHKPLTSRKPQRHTFSVLFCFLFIVFFYLHRHHGPLGEEDLECEVYSQTNRRAISPLHSGMLLQDNYNYLPRTSFLTEKRTRSHDRTPPAESYTAAIIYIMPEDASSLTSNVDTYNLITSIASVYINIPTSTWPIVVFHNGQFDDEMSRADVKSGVFLNIVTWNRNGSSGVGSGHGGVHSTWRAWKLVESLEFVRVEWEDNKNSNDGATSSCPHRFLVPLF